MIARALWYVIVCSLVSAALGLTGVGLTYLVQGMDASVSLARSFFLNFNGILVGGFSYGLLFYIKDTEPQGINSLLNLLEIPDEHKLSILQHRTWVSSSVRQHAVAIVVTVVGGSILWFCGYPNTGFAKIFMAATSISMFYAAGLLSGYFFSSILLFTKLDEICDRVSFSSNAGPYEIEKLNMSFLISSTLAIVALYVAFRGTLTADFTFPEGREAFKPFLIYPIVFFLPGILFTSFYYRYVLRKIQENEVIRKISMVEKLFNDGSDKLQSAKERLEFEKLLLDIRKSLQDERGKSPLFTLKDSPALFISMVFMIQFILLKDTTIRSFVELLLQK